MSKLGIDFDDGMESEIQVYEDLLQFHKGMVDTIENNLAIIRAELNRRKLEAFWAVHPGGRLEAGEGCW